MTNDIVQESARKAAAALLPELSALPTTPLGTAVERNRYVRAIRKAASRTAVPVKDRIVRTAVPRTIVVVDNESDLVELTVMILEAAGHTAYGATCGEAALALAVKHRPDLMLVDLMMPNMSGGDLSKAVRDLPDLQQVRIVIVSGSPEDAVRAEFDQFDLLLKKPVHPDQLLRVVEELKIF